MPKPYGRGPLFLAEKGAQAHGLLLGLREDDCFLKFDRRAASPAPEG